MISQHNDTSCGYPKTNNLSMAAGGVFVLVWKARSHTRAVFAMLLSLAAAAALPACQSQTQNPQVKNYSRDGLLGLTDANPNLPTSPTHHTYRKDSDLIRATINQVPHVTRASITLNGDIANIRLHVPVELPDEEAAKVQRDAYERLSQAMPRYKVKVAVFNK
jgi:hypothetical protein